MNFTQRLKKDKKFRATVIIIGLLTLMVINANAPQEKQWQDAAICDGYNTGGFIITEGQYNGCLAQDCKVKYNVNYADWPVVGMVFEQWMFLLRHIIFVGQIRTDFITCVPCIESGKYVAAAEDADANRQCCSYSANKIKDNWFGKDIFLCKTIPTEQQCNSAEQGIANIFHEITGYSTKIDCKTAYYITIFAGGMLAFMVIGMFI
jgi:hypothetical protein